jgi:hypothetical protein
VLSRDDLYHYFQELPSSVQSDSRFWEFQLIEGAWLVTLSAALIGATVWLVRRRAA